MQLTQEMSIRKNWNSIKMEEKENVKWELKDGNLIKIKNGKEKIVIGKEMDDKIVTIEEFDIISDFYMNKQGEWFIMYSDSGNSESIFLLGNKNNEKIDCYYYTVVTIKDSALSYAKKLTYDSNNIINEKLTDLRAISKENIYEKTNKLFDPELIEKIVKLFPFLNKKNGIINFDKVAIELHKKVGKITDPSYVNKIMQTLNLIWNEKTSDNSMSSDRSEKGVKTVEEKNVNSENMDLSAQEHPDPSEFIDDSDEVEFEPVEEIEEGTELVEEDGNNTSCENTTEEIKRNWTPMQESSEEEKDIDLDNIDLSKF